MPVAQTSTPPLRQALLVGSAALVGLLSILFLVSQADRLFGDNSSIGLDPGDRIYRPGDVESLGLEDGSLAVMSSRRGEVLVKVAATTKSPRGTVFCSFSFGNVPVNVLTGSGYDPITDTAELKVCPVRIEAAKTELA